MTTENHFPLLYTRFDRPPSVSHHNPMSLNEERRRRRTSSYFILSVGRRAHLSSKTVSSAIVTLQRFYMHRCFQDFSRLLVSLACLHLSCKTESERIPFMQLFAMADIDPSEYKTVKDLVFNLEDIVLMTTGFTISTPNLSDLVTDVCHMIHMDANFIHHCFRILHLNLVMTTFCLRYKPEVIACLVVHLTLKWAGYLPPISKENKFWYTYVEPSLNGSSLDSLTMSFLNIVKNVNSRLNSKQRKFEI